MVANVIAMYLVAALARKRSGESDAPTFTMSFYQFVVMHLPAGFKIWFVTSSLIALGVILYSSFRGS
jgi:Gpi18-like mannosyltransferase